MFNKITFYDAKDIVLSGSSTVKGTVYITNILEYDLPKLLIVGIFHTTHQIDTIKLKFLMNDVSFLYDLFYMPKIMDSNAILSKYMFTVQYDRYIETYFILIDQLDIDHVNKTVTLLGVPMAGVISRYSNVLKINLNNLILSVPRKIKHTELTRQILAAIPGNPFMSLLHNYPDLRDYVPSQSVIWATIVANIFSNNGLDNRIGYFFQDPVAATCWYANPNIISMAIRKFGKLANNTQNMIFLNRLFTIDLFYEQLITPALSNWYNLIYNYIGVNPQYNISLSANNYIINAANWINSSSLSIGWYTIGYRSGIAFVLHLQGDTFQTVVHKLIQYGYFGLLLPYIIQLGFGSTPDPLPPEGTHVIGLTKTPPEWVITNNYDYSYRLISNELNKVKLAILFAAFGWSYKRQLIPIWGDYKYKHRFIRYYIEYNNPTNITQILDTGWINGSLKNIQYDHFIDVNNLYKYRYIKSNDIYDNYYHTYDSGLNNVPISILLNNYKIQLDTRFSSILKMNALLLDYNLRLTLLAAKLVNIVNMLALINKLYFTIILSNRPWTLDTIPNQRINRYLYPLFPDDILAQLIDELNVISYKFTPLIDKYLTPYSLFLPDPIILNLYKIIYTIITSNYKRKINITIIGHHDYNFIDNDYFMFRDKLFKLTSVQLNNNMTTTILGVTN